MLLEMREHKAKILRSMFCSLSFSTEPRPSLSITTTEVSPTSSGVPQAQIPRVQADMVEPIWKPETLVKEILV